MSDTSDKQNIQATLSRLDKVLRHQKNVREAGERLGKKLIELGEIKFGLALIASVMSHDKSKLEGIEFEWLHPIHFLEEEIDPEQQKLEKERLIIAIQQHQNGNSHHPEYWGGLNEMPRLSIAEMVCDLYARSTEFGSDVREYINDTFLPKHKVSKTCRSYQLIKKYLDLLLDAPFKPLNK